MSKPSRTRGESGVAAGPRTFFVSAQTAAGRSILQSERMANLFIDVLRAGMRIRRFDVLNFVVMPNHVHLLLRLSADMELERAMQLIKGGFSFRAKKELGFNGEVWQRGFSDVLVADEESFRAHERYIEENPVKAGLASSPEEYVFGYLYLNRMRAHSFYGRFRHD